MRGAHACSKTAISKRGKKWNKSPRLHQDSGFFRLRKVTNLVPLMAPHQLGGREGHSYISPSPPYTIPTPLHNVPLLVEWEIEWRRLRRDITMYVCLQLHTSLLLRGQKREVFGLSTTYPLIEVLLKINRSNWHPLLEKNRPKAKAKDTVSSFPKTGKQHLTLQPETHLPRNNHRLLWAAIMHTSHYMSLPFSQTATNPPL